MTTLIAPFNQNYTYPDAVPDELTRNIFLETIERLLLDERNDIIFLEGKAGSGKSTIMAQFVKKNYKNSISYFVSSIDKYSHSKESFNVNLYQQLSFYLSFPSEEIDNIPDNFIYQIRPHLDRKIRKLPKDEHLYFIFDGFENLNKQSLDFFKDVILDLPWGKAKFIFSGDIDSMRTIIPTGSKLKIKSFPINFFTVDEIEEYFYEFELDKSKLQEIHFLSSRGLPEKLSQIKRNFKEKGVEFVLNELNENKISLFEMDWQKVTSDLQKKTIAILAFSEPYYVIHTLANILQESDQGVKAAVESIPFLSLKGNTVSFINQEYLNFAQIKLETQKSSTLSLLIDYYVTNASNEDGIQLSNLYMQAKRWKDLLKYLSFDTFLKLIEESKSFDSINNQLDIGLKVSKSSDYSYSDYLKFALPKSSFREIEKIDGLENEIKARVSIGDHQGAKALLDNTFLKEDRLKLLAHLAMQQKENLIDIDQSVIIEINNLYKSINISVLEGSAVKLASTLMYSCPDLAIDLVEKVMGEADNSSKLDKVYTMLSLTAINAKNTSDTSLADLNTLKSKISNTEERELIVALSHLGEEFSAHDVIEKSKSLTTSSRKIYLLKNWIKFNIKSIDVIEVVKEAINEVIKISGDETPNANTLMELAQPLPFVERRDLLESVIDIFDTQKGVIVTPTRDYVKLQLLIAEAESTFNISRSTNRLIDVYYYVAVIEDAAIKNDCLVLLWLKLKSIDKNDEIEKKEGLKALAKQDADVLLENLINGTAMHFEVMEYIISYSVEFDSDFVMAIISRLNTQIRRDYAYKLALQKYAESITATETNVKFILSCYNLIKDKGIKDESLRVLLDYLYDAKNTIPEQYGFQILNDVKNIYDSSLRCYGLCKAIKYFHNQNKEKVVENCLVLLKNSWEGIDTLWIKVDTASKIAIQIAEFSKDLAREYLDNGLQTKCDSVFESYSSSTAYFLSLNLCIRAFGGLIKAENNYDNDLNDLKDLIDVIPCSGERIRLYSKLAIEFYQKQDESTFRDIFKKYVITLFSLLSNSLDQHYFIFIFRCISPALYLYHKNTFDLYLENLEFRDREFVLMDCLAFLLKDEYADDHYDVGDYRAVLSYEKASDAVQLVKRMNYDNSLYIGIKEIVESLRISKEISVNQKNIIIADLHQIIENKLPSPVFGINHEGYKIASTIFVDSLKGTLDKLSIETLVSKIKLIPNISDRSLVYHILAREIKFKSSQQKIDILLEAFKEAKKIPSSFDMLMRHEEMLPTLADIDKVQFKKIIQELIGSILSDKEDSNIYNKHRKLVDLLHQHDPKNIGNYIDVLDKDPARNKKLSENMKDRLGILERNATYRDDITKAKKFKSASELSEFSYKLLSKIETGLYTSKEPKDTFSLLEAASSYNLTEAFTTYSYCIENIVKKYQNGTKHQDLLRSVYEATIFNVKLISTLSQSSIQNMRNRYSIINRSINEEKKFFRIGERGLALNFIRNWIEECEPGPIILIDSYFKLEDIDFLKIIKELKPNVDVIILTSKEGLTDVENYEIGYIEAWNKMSHEAPPATTIKIVWIEGTDKTPFHDRYLVSNNSKGLRLGNSYGSIGSIKDAEISELTLTQLAELEDTIIRDYVLGGKNFHNDKRLKNKSFTL